MSEYREASGYCPHCQKRVVGRKQEASHTFWLIATLFSCGIFAIVWIISSFVKTIKPFHCSICGTPLQAFPGAGSSGGGLSTAASSSPSPLLIVGGVLVGLALVGAVISGIGGSLKQKLESGRPAAPSQSASVNATPVGSPPAAKQPKRNSQPQNRRQWAAQYQARMRSEGFANAVCSVSGKNNATLTMRSEAVVSEEATDILLDSGYYNDVFEQGFTKLVLEDDMGNVVTVTR